jgi:hypothetical protein
MKQFKNNLLNKYLGSLLYDGALDTDYDKWFLTDLEFHINFNNDFVTTDDIKFHVKNELEEGRV